MILKQPLPNWEGVFCLGSPMFFQKNFTEGITQMKELDAGVKWFNVDFYPKTYVCRAARYEDGVLPRLREKEITLFFNHYFLLL